MNQAPADNEAVAKCQVPGGAEGSEVQLELESSAVILQAAIVRRGVSCNTV